jgi:hypothetical protein
VTRRPEDAFDEAFRNCSPEEQRHYKGRNDLSGLPIGIQEQLRSLQKMFNDSLRNEKQGVPEHVEHAPFHVDYVDSDVQNALAFRCDDYSFIGITVPLIYAISDVCLLLSKSPTVATLLRVRPSVKDYNALHAVLFYSLINFIVAHEFTHHVHGHVCPPSSDRMFPNEILDAGSVGNLKSQIQEIGADGYAIFHLLANLFDGSGRSWLTVLELASEEPDVQDEALLSLVVVAVGAYLFIRRTPKLDRANIYRLTHPPQAARRNCLMQEAMNWCRENRPNLLGWMTGNRFQQIMNAATEATLGRSGAQLAGDLTAFLRSEEGVKYLTALYEGVNAYKQSLGDARRASSAPKP